METDKTPQEVPMAQAHLENEPIHKNLLNQKGSFLLIFGVVVIILVVLGAWVYYFGIQKNQSPYPSKEQNIPINQPSLTIGGEKFDKQLILKETSFVDSKQNNKKLIVVKTGEEGGIVRADAYIVDESLSRNNAVKISTLSDPDSTLGYAVTSNGVVISISPSPGKKYIITEISIADGNKLVIVDEDGNLVSDKVVGNALNLVKDRCQCGFDFDKWFTNNRFYVKVPTAAGGTYQILIDATTGNTVGQPKEI